MLTQQQLGEGERLREEIERDTGNSMSGFFGQVAIWTVLIGVALSYVSDFLR